MLTYDSYSDIVESTVDQLDIPKQPSGLYDPIRYILEGGGKRLRPVLTVAACDACGGDLYTSLSQAIGLELFHNFTLLHDDVMDKADMRRGRPTVHIRWNEQTAILSGDAMLSLAYSMIGRGIDAEKISAALALFGKTAMEVYEGQQLDMDFERDLDVTVEQYVEMIRLKTSVLLGCACRMGAIMAGRDKELGEALYKYGEQLGIAFQLRDDLLDTYGDPIVFGKRVGGDILNDKKTWLLITALHDDTSGELKEIILSGKPDDEDKITAVKAIYDRLDIRNRCDELISHYTEKAVNTIQESSLSLPARQFFTDLALRSTSRSH